MPDWTKSMQRTYEYMVVDPGTWKDMSKIDNVISSSISWDLNSDTLGSASFDVSSRMSECYIRIYLVTLQNGIKERFQLGTFLVQTPSYKFNGKREENTLDGYSPLIELKENPPPLGYTIKKDLNIMEYVCNLTDLHLRAPVVKTSNTKTLEKAFVSNTEDTWMSFIRDLASVADYRIGLDEKSQIIFEPNQTIDSLKPVWEYTSDNSSILYPSITIDNDIYGIPNVVEAIYSSATHDYVSRVVNDDPNSPVSTVNRGREILYRDTAPNLAGIITQAKLDDYATNLLKSLSAVEYNVSYSHGYCPVRIGDGVLLNYPEAGLKGIKARVRSQRISCTSSCEVSETAEYTVYLWEG